MANSLRDISEIQADLQAAYVAQRETLERMNYAREAMDDAEHVNHVANTAVGLLQAELLKTIRASTGQEVV